MHFRRTLLLILFSSFLLVFLEGTPFRQTIIGSSAGADAANEIWVLRIDGVINPLSARYLETHFKVAHQNLPPKAILLELNTPGGLESSMRKMTQTILNSRVPVVVYVTPPGGRAASAGMFITIAAHLAAMAPGTNIGAAHPVSLGGEKETETRGAVTEKIVNDAAALARSIALQRRRNAKWIESAVRKSVSITAEEAEELNVIDLIAKDRSDLLQSIEGLDVSLAAGNIKLSARNAKVIVKSMNFAERILHAITEPNIAYLLMTLGFIGIIAELYSPGMIFPGVTGAISLLISFAALGSLPFNWVGAALLAIGIALLIFELQTEGFGFLGVAAMVAFILGSLILYRPLQPVSPSMPRVALNPWLIAGITLFVASFSILVLRAILRSRHLPLATGSQTLVGQIAVVSMPLAPAGRVKLGTEEWSAVIDPEDQLASQTIPKGERVEVTAVEGVTLKVKHRRTTP
ncbi:MAG TPA: nodulation protein NfeD [Bdellovibrionota bacterium]|nr:nodulation protein NfeD [Bdellovibrionota bacterium]